MPASRIIIADKIIDHCIEQIQNGVWQPGDKIPSESQFQKEFKVSKVSIRSALQVLRAKGYIETFQGKGSFVSHYLPEPVPASPEIVRKISSIDIRDISEFRSAIELKAIELAIERGTDADFSKMALALEKMKESTKDYERYTKADALFHMGIYEAAHNRVLMDTITGMQEKYLHYLDEMNRIFADKLEISISFHEELFDAIVRRDREMALALDTLELRRNLIRVEERIQGKL